jgi:hypothetical protein
LRGQIDKAREEEMKNLRVFDEAAFIEVRRADERKKGAG